MLPLWLQCTVLLLVALTHLGNASCDAHSPAFPLPQLSPKDKEIKVAYNKIKAEVEQALKEKGSKHLSFSFAVTSSEKTLFEHHHTAVERDEQRPGVKKVTGSSVYRIASNTKSFTVLAILQLQKAGKLNLDDPVNKYLPSLDEHKTGSLPWKDITLRTLATQLSGLPRNLGMVDLSDNPGSKNLGLPDIQDEPGVVCDSLWNYTRSCTKKDLYGFLRRAEPLFAPKQQSTYCNINYILLGLVIEKVTGSDYADYIQKHILDELDMSSTSFVTPEDAIAVLPKGQANSFSMDLGVQNPTGGLYSTSDDMMRWIRYILTHYNGLTPAINWLQPQSFSTGMQTFYGMPWEIFRTDDILHYTERPVTFVTKSGGWPGYTSLVVVVPEYGLGFTALVASSEMFDEFPRTISRIVGQYVVEAADTIAHRQVRGKYTGRFEAATNQNINSSITIDHSEVQGLHVTSWTSRSIDVMQGYGQILGAVDPNVPMHLQLVPTLLFKDEENQKGEIWRILPVQGEDPGNPPKKGPLHKNFCLTDVDLFAYGGRPLGEIVFWSEGKDQTYSEVELTGWRIRLGRSSPGMKEALTNVVGKLIPAQEVLKSWFPRLQND